MNRKPVLPGYCVLASSLVLLIIGQVWANPVMGTVEKVRGKVTQLRPGSHLASDVIDGDKLVEDTSLVSGDNSFVRIKLIDQSILNLGPKSMLVLKETPKSKGPGLVGLLKGKLRAQVRPEQNQETKLLVKTRTAAMGVRGTDFQTIYNPENANTALVTFEGKVAMAQVDERKIQEAVSTGEKKVEVKDANAKGAEVVEVNVKIDETAALTKVLNDKSEQVVEVKGGQYSGTVQAMETVSEPVVISPAQLNALYSNTEMNEKSKVDTKVAEQAVTKVEEIRPLVRVEAQEAPPEGMIDVKKGIYAPKSGGMVDLETGIYVPPPKDSDFNDKLKVFVPKNVGGVDPETGQYLAPQGIKLDAVKGFVVESEKNSSKNKKDGEKTTAELNQNVLLAMTQDLNQNMNAKLILAPKTENIVVEERPLTVKEMFTKDQLALEMQFLSQSLEYSNDTRKGPVKLETKSYTSYEVHWFMSSGTQFQPFITIGNHMIDYRGNYSDVAQGSTKNLTISTGAKLYINDRWSLMATGATEQMPYLRYDSGNKTMDRVARVKVKARAIGRVWEKNKLSLNMDLSANFLDAKRRGDLILGYGYGFEVIPRLRYQIRPVHFFDAGLVYRNELSTMKAPESEADTKRTSTGLVLDYRYYF